MKIKADYFKGNVLTRFTPKKVIKSYLDFRLLRKFLIVSLFILLSGCATIGPPNDMETGQIKSGERVIALVRFTATLDGFPYAAFAAEGDPPSLKYRHVYYGVGGNDIPRFLDGKSLSEGWTYFILKPGSHELWFLSPFGLTVLQGSLAVKHAPHFAFNVPEDAEVIYIGTVHIPVYKRGEGSKWGVVDFNPHDASFLDESNLANELVKQQLPGLSKFKTVIMEPKEEEAMILQVPE